MDNDLISRSQACEMLLKQKQLTPSVVRRVLMQLPTQKVGKNEPLTLDELRDMDGEPVWVQSPGIPEYGRWAIAEGTGESCLFLHDDFTCHDYGKTWIAYRRPPKEVDYER